MKALQLVALSMAAAVAACAAAFPSDTQTSAVFPDRPVTSALSICPGPDLLASSGHDAGSGWAGRVPSVWGCASTVALFKVGGKGCEMLVGRVQNKGAVSSIRLICLRGGGEYSLFSCSCACTYEGFSR